jgi:glutathione-specific gamma-glutamylcyclotransferase
MESHHYRGTPDLPGLVLALELVEGAKCRGLAFHVDPDNADEVMQYLRARELVSDAYTEVVRSIGFDEGGASDAICYVMNQSHHQYAGRLTLPQQAAMILRANGTAGPNTEYLFNTHESLRSLGIVDEELEALVGMVKA